MEESLYMIGMFSQAYYGKHSIYILSLFACLFEIYIPYPYTWYHPVQLIGKVLKKTEQFFYPLQNKLFFGGVAFFISCSFVFALSSLFLFTQLVFILFSLWSGLALGALVREGKKALVALKKVYVIHEELQKNSLFMPSLAKDEQRQELEKNKDIYLKLARQQVSMLVSRDVQSMDQDELGRSLAETLSENFTDAFVAPLFWFALFGPLGLWVYKTVSTADSLWGYRTERYLYFGRVAARADDFFAYIPARVAFYLLLFVAQFTSLRKNWPGSALVRAQARLSASPNAGWSMAAIAFLFHARMGGATMYNGVLVHKPIQGPFASKWNCDKLTRLLTFIQVSGVIAIACLFIILSFWSFFVSKI